MSPLADLWPLLVQTQSSRSTDVEQAVIGTDSQISFSVLSLAAGQAYKLQFTNGTAAKAEGSVLVLDVGSLWQKHPADPPFGIATAAECQQRCAVLPGACQQCEDHRLDFDLSQ